MKSIKTVFEFVLKELFPAFCFKCGARGAYICMRCVEKIPRTRRDEPDFVSVFQYKDPAIRALLWSLKYKGGGDIARICA